MPTNSFAAVQLTLLSVIVALILENLLNQLGGGTANWGSPLPWLQAGLVAITVITIWSGFALILSVSTRAPEAVDFIYPFGLLIALTLAANSVGTDALAPFFMFLALGGVFATWALRAELGSQGIEDQQAGIRSAIRLQAVDTAIGLVMAIALVFATLPPLIIIAALVAGIAVQGMAAFGTVQGWRFVTSLGRQQTEERQ